MYRTTHYWNRSGKSGSKKVESASFLLLRENAMQICYVIYLIVFAKSEPAIDSIEHNFGKTFSVKNLGEPEQFWGIELTRREDELVKMKQTTLIKELL